MREEVKRISKLVAEGKLSPEDAADLIEAFYANERGDAEASEPKEAAASGSTPPPPPPGAVPGSGETNPFRALLDALEKAGKEATESVAWKEVAGQAKQSAKKAAEALKSGLEDLGKGKVKVNLGWIFSSEGKEVSLPLTVPAGKVLRIENPCGDVQVAGGFEVGSVTANATFRGSNADDARQKAEAYTLIIEETEHAVIIRQPDVSGLSVDLHVQAPGAPAVEVRSESGEIEVIGTKAACRVNSRSGDVHLRDLNGPIEVHSESGDLTLEDIHSASLTIENKSGDLHLTKVRGTISARTASGNVTVDQASGKVISIESVSGDVELDIDEPISGTLNVRTVNGDVNVHLPDGCDARLSLSTLRGSVSSGMDLHDEAKTDQRLTGRLGEGTGAIDISAVTGDVRVEMRSAI